MTTKTREKRVLIIGAGGAGHFVFRVMRENRMDYLPVGFIDDNPDLRQTDICGLQVLGNCRDIPQLVAEYGIEELIIAIPSAPPAVLREIADISKGTGARVKIIPSIKRIIDGEGSLERMRDIQVEDLLHRESVETDLSYLAGYLTGKTVLVTGAGGSIGSELCRQIAGLGPGRLVLLGHGENSIFDICAELGEKFPSLVFEPEIADIRDHPKMLSIFQKHFPKVVFHAAAHKHVPLLERHPDEAVKNNVLGTKIVAEAAAWAGTDIFVLISSDKAVYPSNVLGATKKIAETLVLWMNQKWNTRFVAVRFGNVLGSRGSVVPLFKKQIAAGGPVTVTHPGMVRYFMTIPEAVQLVIQAGALAEGGEIFVLDMGAPVRIMDLARDMIILSGREPDRDIEIKVTGVRPGETLVEELLTEEEKAGAVVRGKLLVTVPRLTGEKRFRKFFQVLKLGLTPKNQAEAICLIQKFIPEYPYSQKMKVQEPKTK